MPKHLSTLAVLAALTLASCLFAEPRSHLVDNFRNIGADEHSPVRSVTSAGRAYSSLTSAKPFTGVAGGGLRIEGSWAVACVQFEAVRLREPGDSVTLELSLRYESAPPDTPGAFRVGLYDSGGDSAALHPYNRVNNPGGGRARGYFITVNTGGGAGSNLYRDPGNTADEKKAVLNTGGDNRIIGFAGARFGTEARKIVFTILRTPTGVEISGSVANAPFIFKRDELIGASVTNNFDTLVFGTGGFSAPLVVEAVSITSSPAL